MIKRRQATCYQLSDQQGRHLAAGELVSYPANILASLSCAAVEVKCTTPACDEFRFPHDIAMSSLTAVVS